VTALSPNPLVHLEWRWKPFGDLIVTEVYDLLAARSAVFVVEQNCVYGDIDGLDKSAWHLLGYSNRDGEARLAGYLRVLLPDETSADIRIGRVLTTAQFRGIGLGSVMLERALEHIVAQWPDVAVSLHAQAHLQKFYGAFGFEPISDIHDEDGIPHVWMRGAAIRGAAIRAAGTNVA
jgi:ElaA protein